MSRRAAMCAARSSRRRSAGAVPREAASGQLLAEGEDEVFLVIAHAHRVNGNLGPAGLIRSAGPLAIVGGVVAIGDQDDVLYVGPLVVSGDGARRAAADAGPGDDFGRPGANLRGGYWPSRSVSTARTWS